MGGLAERRGGISISQRQTCLIRPGALGHVRRRLLGEVAAKLRTERPGHLSTHQPFDHGHGADAVRHVDRLHVGTD